VERSLREWTTRHSASHPELRRAGFFGSYASQSWGPGSDVDVILTVTHSALPFHRRPVEWPLEELAVPADTLIYTEAEWNDSSNRRFPFERDVVWVWTAGGP
jgi:predicted nucleotidyltransferase